MQRRNAGATYIASNRLTRRTGGSAAKWVSSLAAAFLVFFVMISSVGLSPHVAYADAAQDSLEAEQDAWDIVDALDPGIDAKDQKGSYLFDQVGSYRDQGNVTTFQGMLWSVFGVRYINDISEANVPTATAPTAAKLGLADPDTAVYACNTKQLGAGTAFYHNCDVPNLMTEFLQDAYGLFDRSGVQGAEAQNAYAGSLFGIPKNLPGDGSVPVNSDFRSEKYTGLELYGYSLPWTTYLGEWDHIKTQSEARLLSNFGFFDHIALTGSAIGGAIANGLTVALDNFSNQLGSTGNIFTAIGGFYSGFFQGAVAGGIAPVLDSSDLNVILSFAWYRVGYANTAYGLRQLSDSEMAAGIRLSFLQMMAQSNPDAAAIGEDLLSVADGGKKPRKPVAKCEVMTVATNAEDGRPMTVGFSEVGKPSAAQLESSAYTGVTRAACETAAKASMTKWTTAPNYNNNGPTGAEPKLNDFLRYDADGNRKGDTVGTWKSWNSAVLAKAAALGVDCSATYPNDAVLADSIWTDFKNCWGGTANGTGTGYTGGPDATQPIPSPYKWNEAANNEYEKNQGDNNTDWIENVLSQVMVQAYMQENQEAMNFNAPWRRYICLDDTGADMKSASTGTFVFAFTADGKVNPACGKEFRSPIQNGIFGNGYAGGANTSPPNDTRHISNFGDPIGIVFAGTLTEVANQMQAGVMAIGQFATMISSEVISWTYMPILDSLGITDIIVNLIEGFRDSLFFPLAFMIVAGAACFILWSAFKNRAYREGFTSILMICAVYIMGAFLMYKSTETIDFVQRAPAVVEEAVVGTIFSASSVGNDELCTSTAAAVSTSGNIFGKMADTSASESTRELICNNWRTFTFTPWVYGQFGADFKELYANGTTNIPSNASTWENTNESLVGSAGVNMGNGTVVSNWALYQLDTLKTGTATTADTTILNGRIDPNFYRIIDAQYGPNNGAGTETGFSTAWSGTDQGERFTIAITSSILAIFGAVVVISYSVTKIVITLLSTLMLVFLPFAFLMGLAPSKRSKLKDYALSIVGMMIQRIVLIIVLSLFFVMLLTFASAGQGNYWNSFLMAMLICLVFWLWRKSIMGYVFSSIGNPQFGRQWREDPAAAMREWPVLKTVAQKAEEVSSARSAITSAAIGSVLSRRAPVKFSMKDGKPAFSGAVADELKSRGELLRRTQRRQQGFEGLRSGLETAKEVAEETKTKATLDEDTQQLLNEVFRSSDASDSPVADRNQKREIYELLKDSPGYVEISTPVLVNGHQVLDENREPVLRKIIVAEDNPSVEIVEAPEDEIDGYGRLMKPQDRRLAQDYKQLEKKSLENRKAKMELREKAMANPDSTIRDAYSKHTQPTSLPALEEFRKTEEMKDKAVLFKKLEANIYGDLRQVMEAIDRELPDAEGYTDGDRKKVKQMVQANAKETLEQEKNEYQMERIRKHLQYVAQQEYVNSDPRRAAKDVIDDMNTKVREAARKLPADDSNGG
jgi:hypothetical protein